MFSHLPISPYLAAITQALSEHNNLVLQAEPGAGKSTAVPWHLLKHLPLAEQKIIMLEPRRLAARSIAQYLATQMQEPLGQTVGYRIRNERKVGAQTRLEIVTEGVLTGMIQQDPALSDIGLLIFDEFHERSLHADLGLSLSKEVQTAYHPGLKILVMSATMNTQVVSQFLDQAPVIKAPGRQFAVTTHYLDKPVKISHWRDYLPRLTQLVITASRETMRASGGDILVFLPGKLEIHQLIKALQTQLNEQDFSLLPLYGGLPWRQQQAVWQPDPYARAKVICATNIAETSVTLPQVTSVVDSGLQRVALYDVASGMTRLVTQRIAAASAQQRQGRAGRVQAGSCYRLWTPTQQSNLADYAPPEITVSDLTDLYMQCLRWGVNHPLQMDWLTPPPQAHCAKAQTLLQQLGLINDADQFTLPGKQASEYALPPRFASLMVAVQDESIVMQLLACELIAVLTDPQFLQGSNLHTPKELDLVTYINRLHALKASPIKQQKNQLNSPVFYQLNYWGIIVQNSCFESMTRIILSEFFIARFF